VDCLRLRTVRGEDGAGELEEGVGPAMEAFVERATEGTKSIGMFHGVPIMHPPEPSASFATSGVGTQAKVQTWQEGKNGAWRSPAHVIFVVYDLF
jgi:hypothetical protein